MDNSQTILERAIRRVASATQTHKDEQIQLIAQAIANNFYDNLTTFFLHNAEDGTYLGVATRKVQIIH